MPPVFTVCTENPALGSGGRMNLSAAAFGVSGGGVSGLSFSSVWPGGDKECSFGLDLPPSYASPALKLGRRLLVYAGSHLVWQGVLDDPVRGHPWTVSANGLGPVGANNAAAVFSSHPTEPAVGWTNDVVDGGIARGALRWRRTSSLPDPTEEPPANPGQVDDYLSLVASSVGQQRGVNQRGVIEFKAPTGPAKWLIDAIDTPGGRSLGEFWTAVHARYLDDATNPAQVETVTVTNPEWTAQGVVIEHPMDLTGFAPMNSAQAGAFLTGVLAATAPSPTYTGSATVHRGHLRSADGALAELACVRAGDRARFCGVAPDPHTTGLTYSTNVDVQIGETRYDADSDTLQVTPVAATSKDLMSVLAGLEAERLRIPLASI